MSFFLTTSSIWYYNVINKLKDGVKVGDKKHFSKSVRPQCAYCLNGRLLSGGEEIFCIKKGLRDLDDECRSYKYDPLKRVPASKDIGRDYKATDFML